MAIQELDSPTVDLTYRVKYSSIHLNWIQFFNNEFNVTPRLIFFYEDRCVIIIESNEFNNCKIKWDNYRKKTLVNNGIHIRIIQNASTIEGLIKNWYPNMKDIEIKVNFKQEIEIKVAKNLRQFVIGREGFELRMLTHFLNNYINIHGNITHKNSFICVVI